MRPFEFIILFFSFIYTLALTHLLFAWTRMIRYRRTLILSWPHLLWMMAAFFNLSVDWISLWDFRSDASLSLLTIVVGFTLVVINYFTCALVSPDFEAGETFDMNAFHQAEGRTYIGAMLVMFLAALLVNLLAGAALGISKWSSENNVVAIQLLGFPLVLIKRQWAQVLAPLIILACTIVYGLIYYPTLAG